MRKIIALTFCALILLAGGTIFFSKSAQAQLFQSLDGCEASYNCGKNNCTETTTDIGGETATVYKCKNTPSSSASSKTQFPVDNNSASSGQTTTTGTTSSGNNASSSAASSAVNAISNYLNKSKSSSSGSSSSGGGCESGFTQQAGVCVPSSTNLPSGTVDQIITNFMNWLLMIFSSVAVIAFLISGIQYLVSTGDENMMQTAKRNMIYSIIGVLVGLCGLVVLKAITALLSASSTI